MLLSSVVIVLREVLDVALLMSVLLASARFLELSPRWVGSALVFGVLGAASYAYLLGPVSNLFDGVGQEICNASLQFAAFFLLVAIVFFVGRRMQDLLVHQAVLRVLMATVVATAIIREGAEILIYVSGFWDMNDLLSAVGIGSLIGACIGYSIGVLIYFLLLAQPSRRAMPISVALLFLIAAGMSSQATRLLIQADWISTGGALWNTVGILAEDSLAGQLLHALIGYEASPSEAEVIAYLGSVAVMAASFFLGRFTSKDRSGDLR